MIKNTIFILSLTQLFGCATTSQERLARAKTYEERSERANQQASKIGSLPGTPDNIESMERAYEESAYYKEKAHDTKYKNTWAELIVGVIALLIGIATK
ncbi:MULTISPECIES: hypothetical protein [unclassified Oleiphilus]|uniref:hypothetical protein n=1 Tax=unclassified Oleiphilus TaxID=2631174 RepID=UPI0007C21A0B|nr:MULTISPECIES: hypothetical protein [unclassified Oleiphilus]KZY39431.1 hypothetical protein A3729_15190 [Oleiphilus sp. HI0043]KZZ64328.1 hypothetical protein A3763_05505 [Oleiphilus sp. HI0128]